MRKFNHQLLQAKHASFHGRVLQCKPKAFGLLQESMVLSSTLLSRSMEIFPYYTTKPETKYKKLESYSSSSTFDAQYRAIERDLDIYS